ncbi:MULTISPECIES: hypothetical protein [Stenotrophomonas]|uniref:hypothetical protein n=1 Tax=Stenotrophomonas TaxID=40323 RepID=UPI000DE6E759|nr:MULTISPECIES: hypothetical protein [Stenotrophomonas]MBN4945171.1 hypothetical protein [Stenotrophomonas maltophilia]MDQ7316081.1 hypothetical protein [Stenotrophomonas sp. Sm8]SSM89986.1 Uncharacterised protein [Acinetobacter baumannii]HDS1547164.1 hypothetical protein [Stenotrophomonas maltophilia]
MSKRIDDAVDVLHAILVAHKAAPCNSSSDVRRIRIRAVKDVAEARGVTHQDIADVYIRRLNPYVKQTRHFDALVSQWIQGDSIELKAALEKSCLDRGDSRRVEAFFSVNHLPLGDEV